MNSSDRPHAEPPASPVIGDDRVCVWQLREVAARNQPALFLDRDGVIVDEVNYLHRVEDVRVMPGAAELIHRANSRSVPVVVITNQAGIGRGRYDWPDFIAVQKRIDAELSAAGAAIDAVFACPFHAEAMPPYDVADHPDRKPNPGMLLRAAALLGLDLTRSWIVGDTAADMQAGIAAGLRGGVHLLCGHGERERADVEAIAADGFTLRCAADLVEADAFLQLQCPDR